MSLDFYVYVPEQRAYVRENGTTAPMLEENTELCECIHIANITHNMGEMARHVPVSDTLTLYNILWRPDESNLKTTDDIMEYVTMGLKFMREHFSELLQYNPDNGWGSYEGLVTFTKRVLGACLLYPRCLIEANR